jgi:hypothetical protein
MGLRERVASLSSSTKLDRTATVAAGSAVLFNELDLLEVVGANDQSAVASAASCTHCQSIVPPNSVHVDVGLPMKS